MAEPVKIPFFHPAPSYLASEPDIAAYLDDASFDPASDHLTFALESALGDYTGARHVVAVASGTDALVALLLAAGIGPGDDVLVPAYSFFASASSVALTGARPVFVDIDEESYGMDPLDAERAITPTTRAVMPAHLFTQPADAGALADLAAQHSIMLIEDSAEAIGMRVNGRHAGLFGRGGVLSFFPSKTLGALGDAGAVLTDDAELAKRIIGITRGSGGRPPVWASRCDELQAAVLLGKLRHLDSEIADRRRLRERYDDGLGSLAPRLRTPRLARYASPGSRVDYVYQVQCDDRDALESHLNKQGISTDCYYPLPLNEQPAFRRTGIRRSTPIAARLAKHSLALPLYAGMPDRHVEEVVDEIRAFYGAVPRARRSVADTSSAGQRPTNGAAGILRHLRETALSGEVILGGQCSRLERLIAANRGFSHCVAVSDEFHARLILQQSAASDAQVVDLGPGSPSGGVADGAAIVTDDAELAARLRMTRNHGRDNATRYFYHYLGCNSRFDEVAARHLLHHAASLREPGR